jgi:hypothetical protein
MAEWARTDYIYPIFADSRGRGTPPGNSRPSTVRNPPEVGSGRPVPAGGRPFVVFSLILIS